MGSLSDPPHEDPPWEAAQVPWPQEQQPAKTCCPEKPTEKPLQNFSPEEKVPSHKRDKISLGHKQAGSPDTLLPDTESRWPHRSPPCPRQPPAWCHHLRKPCPLHHNLVHHLQPLFSVDRCPANLGPLYSLNPKFQLFSTIQAPTSPHHHWLHHGLLHLASSSSSPSRPSSLIVPLLSPMLDLLFWCLKSCPSLDEPPKRHPHSNGTTQLSLISFSLTPYLIDTFP